MDVSSFVFGRRPADRRGRVVTSAPPERRAPRAAAIIATAN